MPITSWSHSRLGDFEKCKYRAYLLHDQRVQEPQRALAAGKTEHANDRGTRIHQGCEDYVSGKIASMPAEAAKFFTPEMAKMRELYAQGVVSLEGEWGMNQNWEPWDWNGRWVELNEPGTTVTDFCKTLPERGKPGQIVQIGKAKSAKMYTWVAAWLRLKLDALVFVGETEAIAIDYKSGRKYGNEIKHAEQLQLYQLVTFLRYPQLEKVTTELWYLDVDELTQQTFTRQQGLRFLKNWNQRGTRMTTCEDFPPNPNIHSCKWCMLGPWEGATGHCQVGRR